MADERETPVEDTERHDVLMAILRELRELRQEQTERNGDLDERIDRLEQEVGEIKSRLSSMQTELKLVSNEFQRQGSALEDLHTQCRKRLEICRGSNSDERQPRPSPTPTAIGGGR
jgi:archaellum component FlaC